MSGDALRLFRLEPRRLNSPLWAFSTEWRPIIVRAQSADEARRIAARAFDVATDARPGSTAPRIPWRDDDMVAAMTINVGFWRIEGPPGVVYVDYR